MVDVSVVIAVKNEEKHICEALNSVLAQENIEYEVVVVDDGSTDETFSLISDLALRKKNIRVFKNPGIGKCAAFNYGVAQAEGDFICLFAGDDVMPAGALSARRKALESYCSSDNVVGLCKLKSFSDDKRFDGQIVPKGEGVGGYTGVSYLMSSKVAHSVFPVPESLPNEDTWLEVAFKYNGSIKKIHCGIVGCLWRVHENNSINMQINFDEYNQKLTPRMEALYLYKKMYSDNLNSYDNEELDKRIKCETARRSGSVVKVLACDAPLVERLRALSAVNPFFYNIRRGLFSLLSGW